VMSSPSNLLADHIQLRQHCKQHRHRVAHQGALMPNAASAMDALDMAQPSPHIVDRSPAPSTPMGSLAHEALHCVYKGADGMMEEGEGVRGRAATQQSRSTGSHTIIGAMLWAAFECSEWIRWCCFEARARPVSVLHPHACNAMFPSPSACVVRRRAEE